MARHVVMLRGNVVLSSGLEAPVVESAAGPLAEGRYRLGDR